MKYYIAFIMICAYLGTSIGQVQYSKNLDFAAGNFDLLNNIVPLEDGFVIMTRGVKYPNNSEFTQDGLVARIDKKGNVVWKHRIYSDYNFVFISYVGNLLVRNDRIFGCYSYVDFAGGVDFTKIMVFSIDVNGNDFTSNYLDFNSHNVIASNIMYENEQIMLFILSDKKEQTFIKLNDKLELVTNHIIELDQRINANSDFSILRDSNSIIHSHGFYDNQDFIWLKIREYDLDLNIIREFDGLKADEFLSDVVTIPTEDNGFMVAWNKDLSHTLYDTFPFPSAIFKLDSLFHVEWEYVFVHRGAKQFSNFRYVGDGKYLGCGASDFLSVTEYDPNPKADYNAWAFLINEDGSLDWEKQIYDTRYKWWNAFFDGIKTDFGYAFVGALDTIKETPSPYLNDPDSWYFTLDENGCWNGNCNEFIFIDGDSTSFTLVSTEEPIVNQSLKAYPNPSNGVVTIEHEGSREKKLVVYDILGNRIMSQVLYAKKSIIDLSDMPNATYILNVLNSKGEIIENQKIIIQH